MGTLWQDLRYGIGRVRKAPLVAAVASLTLGLAIGANSTIFSLLDALFFRPLPVEEPHRWARISTGTVESPQGRVSYPDFEDYRVQLSSFTDLVASGRRGALLRIGDTSERIVVEVVSRNYFDALGVAPALGRTWLPTTPDARDEDAVVISHDLWRRRFGSDPVIAGKTIHLSGSNVVVGGVAPRSFPGLDRLIAVDAWISTETWTWMDSGSDFQRRDLRWLDVWGKLADSAAIEKARAECRTVTARLAQSYPETNKGRASTVVLETQERQRSGFVLGALLMTLAGLVVLVCCANIANLLLAQSEARRREMATRRALGASRARIAGQVLTEGLLLSAIGGAFGLLLAWWLIGSLPALLPQTSVRLNLDFRVDARVFAFTSFVCLLATLVFGSAPALHAARVDLMSVLRGERSLPGRMKGRFGVRNLLVVAQVAACVALLTTSGLLIRSLVETSRIPTGFERKPMLLLDINPGLAGYGRDQAQLLLEDLRGRLDSLPGAERVSYAMRAPLSPSGGGAAVEVSLPAVELGAQEPGLKVKYNSVGPRYFTTMGIRILQGRAFETQDGRDSEPVVLINQTMALRFWPEDDPVGEGIRVGDVNWQIVGVVEDAKINHLRERPEPYLYFPMAQRPRSEVTVLIETALEPVALVDPVRATVRSIAPGVPILQLTTQDELMHYALYNEHMYARLALTLGLLGLCLATTGLFGVISYLVRQRTHEIGIRLALGAQSNDVLMNFVKRGLTLSAVGIALGSSVSLFAADLLAPFLQGVSPRDPLSFSAAAGVVSLAAVLASYLPARRAAEVDPMQALRYE